MGYLSEIVKISTGAPTAAGTSTITGSAIDMAGFDGAMFVVRVGTPATNNSLKLTQCDTIAGTYADVANTSVGSHATDTPLIVDIQRPTKQFIKYAVVRGTSTTIDTVCITQYNARTRSTTMPTNTQIERHLSPSEGTA